MRRAGTFVMVALVVAAATFLITDRDEPTPSDVAVDLTPVDEREAPEPTPSPTEEAPPRAGFDRYTSEAGYSFDHPESWSVDERGSAVEISAPDSSAVISFGIAPSGDIRSGVGEFLEAIEKTYDVSEVRGPTSAVVGSSDGVAVEGTALNDDRVTIDFRAMVVDGGETNFAIALFTSSAAPGAAVDVILGSFTTSS